MFVFLGWVFRGVGRVWRVFRDVGWCVLVGFVCISSFFGGGALGVFWRVWCWWGCVLFLGFGHGGREDVMRCSDSPTVPQ